MAPLYLETNFLLSFAYGQNPDSERLLLHVEKKTIDIVLPEVCAIEAIASWRNRRSRLLDLTREFSEPQRELARWDSTSATEASDMFRDLPVKLELAHSAARTRLFDCLNRLNRRARLIGGDRVWFDPASKTQRLNGDVDDYICAAVISDATSHGSPAYFLSENKDFHEPSVVSDLRAAGVTVLENPADVIKAYP